MGTSPKLTKKPPVSLAELVGGLVFQGEHLGTASGTHVGVPCSCFRHSLLRGREAGTECDFKLLQTGLPPSLFFDS